MVVPNKVARVGDVEYRTCTPGTGVKFGLIVPFNDADVDEIGLALVVTIVGLARTAFVVKLKMSPVKVENLAR